MIRTIFSRLFIGAALLTSYTFGQTDISGAISTNTTWDLSGSPYSITGNTVVMDGATIFIQSGVNVYFNSDVNLKFLSGSAIIAQGTEMDSIYFAPSDTSISSSTSPISMDLGVIGTTLSSSADYSAGSVFNYCVFTGFKFASEHIFKLNVDTLLVNNSRFSDNSTDGAGSAFYEETAVPGTYLIIKNSTLNNNSASFGGVISGFRNLQISHSNILNNSATNNGGFLNLTSVPTWEYGSVQINYSNFIGNTASSGGSLYINGHSNRHQNTTINNCDFISNEANTGAVLFLSQSDFINSGVYSGVSVSSCLIWDNYASEGGTIILGNGYKNAQFLFQDNIFVNNRSSEYGSVFNLSKNGTLDLRRNIFSNNYTTNSDSSKGSLIHCTPVVANYSGQLINPANTLFTENGDTNTFNTLITGKFSGSQNAFINNYSESLLRLPSGSTETIAMDNNYWGTKLANVIDSQIYDFYDDPAFNTPIASYSPFLLAPPEVLAGSPSSIESVSLATDTTFQVVLTENISPGDTLNIELTGTDTDSLSKGVTAVWVINTMTQDTVIQTLVESSIASGLFRGEVYTAETTDMVNNYIQGQDGQVLKVVSRSNPNQLTTVIIGDTPLPILSNFTIPGENDLTHTVSHIPIFFWSYLDPLGAEQSSYQIQISSDPNYSIIDMWESGVMGTTDTSATYEGISLTDGTIYFARLQVVTGNGIPSNYAEMSFRMNSTPSAPTAQTPIDGLILTNNAPLLLITNALDAESDILFYDFQLATNEIFETIVDSSNNVPEETDSTSWQIINSLSDNIQYWWRVRANDGFENGEYSTPASFIINAENDTPAEFNLTSPLAGEAITSQSPLFTWDPAVDPDPLDTVRYVLYLDTPDPGLETFNVDTDTSFQLLNVLEDNTSYHWKVVARDLAGATTTSTGGYQSFTVNTSNDLPDAFNLLAPIADMMVTTLTPEFLWEASADPDDETIVMRSKGKDRKADQSSSGENSVMVITGYDFYLSTDANLADVTPVEVIGTSYIPTEELIENMVYYWAVSALDDSGGVTFSDTASFWTNSQNDLPEAFSMLEPLGLPLLGLSTLTPTFTWTSSSDADLNDELIYRLQLGTSTWDMHEFYVGPESSWTPTEPLWDNTVYSWQVLAEDLSGAVTIAGIGDSAAFAHFYTNLENENPEPAILLSPDSVVVLTDTPTFIWERSFDPDPFEFVNYEVHWWYEGSEWDSILTEETSVTISNPLTEDNKQYFWQVISMDDEGGIAQSQDFMFWVDFLPEPPGTFALLGPEDESAGNSTRPELTWEPSLDPDPFDNVSYQIALSTDSNMVDIVYEGSALPETHIPDIDLQNDTRYYWQVSAHDEDSLQTLSDVWTFDVGYMAVDDGLALPTEYVLDQNYPNPFNPSTTIRYGLPEEANVSLVIYDVRGQVVQTLESGHQSAGWYDVVWNGHTADGKTISTGIYFARLVAGEYSQVVKMLYLK